MLEYISYKNSAVIGALLFIVAAIVGISNYQHYGLSWDEKSQREIGRYSYEYVFDGNTELLEFKDRDYGVAIELPLYAAEKIFGISDSRSIYLMRHLVSHLLFLISCFCLYVLIAKIYKSSFLASTAFLMLLSHPRIYAHSFFNTKDLPFLSVLIITLLLFYTAQKNHKPKHIIAFSLLSGLLINIRIVGFIVPLFYIGINLLNSISNNSKKPILRALLYTTFTLLTLYITWPYLWNNPIENFFATISNMSQFRWNSIMMFFGKAIEAKNAPWYYIPAYLVITTPIFYCLLFLSGTAITIAQLIKSTFNAKNLLLVLSLLLFFTPLLAAIILKSTVYDGWRQFFFIYAPFVIISVNGLSYFYKNASRLYVRLVTYIAILVSVAFMIYLHPYQNVYFNSLFLNKEKNYFVKNFDFDYWGASYNGALEYILKSTESYHIKVSATDKAGLYNLDFLKEYQKARFEYVDNWKEADYLITTYRYHSDLLSDYKNYLVFEEIRLNSPVFAVYKLD